MTGRLACVTSQDVGCVGRHRPGGPALSGLLSLRGSGRLGQRHERLSLRSPRSSGRERGLRAGGLVACRRSSFFRLLVQSSVPSCAPVVVKREPISSSCGDSLVRRARPAPGSAHAVARNSAWDRVQIAVTAGRARECSRRSRLTAHARGRAFARHPPGGRTNMLPQGSSTRCLAQQAPEPIAGCLGAASPTTADRGS